ncbi:MAG: PEP-CTERM sorting domain-containing protein [Verrucomicrobiota bacterium]|nr:PEP-CTERM sorting domain-containing protein [Verrucomicrobiota bacterium]
MKKILALLFLVIATPAFADFTIILDAGRLKIDATTSMPLGSVLVLVAAGGDGSFSNSLSAGQYVSGNDVLLSLTTVTNSSGAFNIAGGPEETLNVITINTASFPGLAVGDLIALRWFPQISQTQFQAGTTPAAGNNFGTYNPLFWGNPNNNPDGGNTWSVPGPGATVNLNFYTTSASPPGTQNPLTGYAQFSVIPEPSTWALLSCGLIGAVGLRLRKKRA